MAPNLEVRTTAGAVRGRRENAIAVFRGIPYAQRPVGAHRFARPAPVEKWNGVRDARWFGPPAPQSGAAGFGQFHSEWLTLNVWSPDLGAAGMPVMVWIHGGRYLEGHSGNPHQDGATLARSGVVVVSVNYRVGMEGFARVAGAPNNRGLLDQIAALQWVHENVAAFGGDPANVTVFGQSAGGGSIAALLAMPASVGLFGRAIIQSPPGTFFTEDLAAAICSQIAADIGTHATAVDLRRYSPGALVTASEALLTRMPTFVNLWGPMALTPTPFSPIVDGTILPETPWAAMASGAARGIDLLIGHTRDEYSLFNPLRGLPVTDELLTDTINRLAPQTCRPADYRNAYPDASTSQLYETVNADWLFCMPTEHLAAAHHIGGGMARLYELAWSFNAEEGASHSLDVLLIFGTLTHADIAEHPTAYPDAVREYDQLSHAMRNDWVAFATSGETAWGLYDPATRTTRVYDAAITDVPYPSEASRRLWADHRFTVLDLST